MGDIDREMDLSSSDDELMGTAGAGKKALLLHASAHEEESDEESHVEDVTDVPSSDEDSSESDGEIDWARRVKQRVLICASRGISHRQRHLLTDLVSLLPHSKKENKLDQKKNLATLNEMAELDSCNKIVYMESRRGTDLYLWASNAPNGPSVKFEVLNVHTMDELNMTGNHLKGSRTLLSFDSSFETCAHWKLIKELLQQIFNVPRGHRRSKPFFDHIMSFSIADGKVWIRNFQISEEAPAGTLCKPNTTSSDVALNEVGPRFVLNPIKVFQGSFGGLTLWENSEYITPTAVRRAEKIEQHTKHAAKDGKKVEAAAKKKHLELPADPLASVFA